MRCMIICINGIQYVASQLKPQPRFGHDQGNENSESWMTFFLLWQSGEKQGERQESATFATFSLWLAWRHPLFHPFCIFFFLPYGVAASLYKIMCFGTAPPLTFMALPVAGCRCGELWSRTPSPPGYLSATQRVYVIFSVCVPNGDKWILGQRSSVEKKKENGRAGKTNDLIKLTFEVPNKNSPVIFLQVPLGKLHCKLGNLQSNRMESFCHELRIDST